MDLKRENKGRPALNTKNKNLLKWQHHARSSLREIAMRQSRSLSLHERCQEMFFETLLTEMATNVINMSSNGMPEMGSTAGSMTLNVIKWPLHNI